jgi:hypothetical protein
VLQQVYLLSYVGEAGNRRSVHTPQLCTPCDVWLVRGLVHYTVYMPFDTYELGCFVHEAFHRFLDFRIVTVQGRTPEAPFVCEDSLSFLRARWSTRLLSEHRKFEASGTGN